MRWGLYSLGMVIAAPIGAVALAWSGTGLLPLPAVPAPTELLAQSLYMRGTKIGSYTDDDASFVAFANGVIANTNGAAPLLVEDTGDDWMHGDQVEYNGGFWPVSQGGLDDLTYGASVEQGLGRLGERIAAERRHDPDGAIVVYGYSQSAVILSRYKAQTDQGNIVYVLVSNPTRPNGGILSRFRGFTIPIVDIPLSGPAPTASAGWHEGDPPTTYDTTQQYDGWADFPLYPLNALATANAALGIVYLHSDYETALDPDEDFGAGAHTDTHTYGDTVYYTVGTDLLPLLRPFEQVGVPRPVLLALDAPLRVAVEQGYDRTINPGESTAARVVRIANPVTDLTNFLTAIPVGIDDGLQASGYGRPLNTTPAGMYGVGGPQVTPPNTGDNDAQGLAQDDAPRQAASEPDDPPPHRLTLAEPGERSTVPPPGRHRAERPQVRGPISFTRSIANTITHAVRADTAESSTQTDEKTETAERGGKRPRHAAASSGGTDDQGGYVGKHRKADESSE